MTEEELRRLPPLLTVPVAARVLGVGRTVAYELVRRGEWPTPVIRVGHQIRVPRAPLIALLGLSTAPSPPPFDERKMDLSSHAPRSENSGWDHVQALLLP